MKCFLLLLAFELVTSDKLDHAYLPPPGSKFSGGSPVDLEAPLEYPKVTDLGTTRDGPLPDTFQDGTLTGPDNQPLDDGMSKTLAPIDYSTSTYPNNFSQSSLIPSNVFGANDATKSPSRPEIVSYNSFPPKSSDADLSPYLTQKPYMTPTANTGHEISNSYKRPAANGEAPGYYYFVPSEELQTFRDDKTNQGPSKTVSDDNLNVGLTQYPQANNGYLLDKGQSFVPKTATSEVFVQNYRPSSFGYYGGNPMIMMSQNPPPQEIGNENTSKYGGAETNFMTMSKKKVLPFQTPLVGTNIQKSRKSSVAKSSSSQSKYTDKPIYPKKNVPITIEQRKSFPINSKLRPERPQAETDQNAFILNYDNVLTPEGYSYSFDTSNGIHKDESGTATNGVTATGSYSYTGDDGKLYSVTYTADENGFQPRGNHLPTPPPIPEAILKVIEQATKDKAAGIFDDGSYDEGKYGHMNYQGAMDRYPSYYYKKQNVPKADKNTDGILSTLTEGQRETSVKSEIYQESNTGPVSNGEVSLTNDIKSIDDQSVNQLLPNSGRNKIESRNRLPKPSDRDSPIQNSNKIPLRSQQLSSRRRRPVFDANGIKKRVLGDTSAKNYNQDPNSNMMQKTPDTGKNILNQDDGQIRYQEERLSPSVLGYNQNENKGTPSTDILFQTQSPDIKYTPNGIDSKAYNQDQLNQVTQVKPDFNKIPLSPVTSYDNGYYYVPPIRKFQRNKQFKPDIEQPFIKKQPYVTTGIPTQYDINASINKRTGIDNIKYLETEDENQTPTEDQYNEDSVIINDITTREPFIKGPIDQGNINFYDGKKSLRPNENNQNEITTLTNDLGFPYYVSTTTPLPPQTSQFGNQPTVDGDYNINQYYQTTINPAIFEQTLPNSVENRLYIPNGTPEIRVSQNVVTSTYRPDTFSDGINLEVNQNVKISGVGRLKPTDVKQEYPENVSTFTDGFFKADIPEEQSTFTGTYPQENFGGLTPDKVLQRTNQDLPFANDFFSTERPVIRVDTGSTGYFYPNPGFERQPDVDIDGFLKDIGSVPNDFGLIPGEDRTTPTDTIEDHSPTTGIIGEDFSGPKQPQKFDPETGYFYK